MPPGTMRSKSAQIVSIGSAAFRRRAGQLPGDRAGHQRRAHRPVAQARVIVGAQSAARFDQSRKSSWFTSIMGEAVTRGASGLRGARPVAIDVTVVRFHALTFEAEQRGQDWGVHNIQLHRPGLRRPNWRSACSQQPRSGPSFLRFLVSQMRDARQQGRDAEVDDHQPRLKTVVGWLGTGPDNRGEFSRQGN
jgi:hypothetical protein